MAIYRASLWLFGVSDGIVDGTRRRHLSDFYTFNSVMLCPSQCYLSVPLVPWSRTISSTTDSAVRNGKSSSHSTHVCLASSILVRFNRFWITAWTVGAFRDECSGCPLSSSATKSLAPAVWQRFPVHESPLRQRFPVHERGRVERWILCAGFPLSLPVRESD